MPYPTLGPAAQAYPTTARTFALGCNNAMSRVGALLAPFLAVDMASRSAAAAHGAEGIIVGCCLAAAVATAALPMETSGRQLTVRSNEGTQLSIGMMCRRCHAHSLGADNAKMQTAA